MAIIVIPTLGLLALGVQSVRRQRQAIEVLTAANLRLAVERVAESLERRVLEAGTLALRDAEVAGLTPLLARTSDAERQRALRDRVQRVARRHPIVAHWLLLRGGRMQLPGTGLPLPVSIEVLLNSVPHGSAMRFAAAFAEAERLEASSPGSHRAAMSYRRAVALAGTSRLRGIALARAARSYRAARDDEAAAAAWREVRARHGDDYDLFHQPYGLAAALELCELEGRPACSDAVTVAAELAAGRCELTATQAAGLVARLERVAPPAGLAAAVRSSAYLRNLRIAEAVEGSVASTALRSDEVRLASVRVEGQAQPVVHGVVAPATAEGDAVAACLVLDTDWAATTLLPEVARAVGAPVVPALGRSSTSGVVSAGVPPIVVPLRAAFEGWALAAPAPEADAADLRLDTAVFGGTTLAVVGVLVLGITLMVRDVSRQSAVALRGDARSWPPAWARAQRTSSPSRAARGGSRRSATSTCASRSTWPSAVRGSWESSPTCST